MAIVATQVDPYKGTNEISVLNNSIPTQHTETSLAI